jgi:chaperone required for assembly of F1-ATPase
MKRFWQTTRIIAHNTQFQVQLDEKPLKLPGGKTLTVPFQPLAEAIAAEWGNAGEQFTTDDLPLTRLAATAQDRVRHNRPEIIRQLTAFGMNDLLCYRAAGEPALAAREDEVWQPWIDWADHHLGIRLALTSGITHLDQSPECQAGFIARLTEMTDYQLAGLGVIVPALGSLVLGLAVEAGALPPDAACDCAQLEERWQEERWGADDEAVARRRAVLEDVAVSAQFIRLCGA